MVQPNNYRSTLFVVCLALILGQAQATHADGSGITAEAFRMLQQQNETMLRQLKLQQSVIDSLSNKVSHLEQAKSAYSSPSENSSTQSGENSEPAKSKTSFGLNKVVISGEGGIGFLKSGSEGAFPHGEFRVEEAKLFIDAPVFEDVYFYTEINLRERDSYDLTLNLGECYIDFENLSQWWKMDNMLSLRLGRIDIPFGEEYLTRDSIDNPLISHSLTDFWGVDAGVELYGHFGKFSYTVAAQNGGGDVARDYSDDKSVAGRISYDPAKWLHFSVSAMRTGDLKMEDYWSGLWFANGWIVPIGGTNTTSFHANVVEGDISVRLPHGNIHAFGGYLRYDDNDPNSNNGRDLYFYSIELVHDLTHKLYAGARFSEIFANNGYPMVGNADMNSYLFGPLTTELWRLSLGLGYRWSQNLVVKAEYSFEHGKEASADKREHEDLFGIEAAFKF